MNKKFIVAMFALLILGFTSNASAWVYKMECHDSTTGLPEDTFLRHYADGHYMVYVNVWRNNSYVGGFFTKYGHADFEVPHLAEGDVIKYKQQVWGMGTTITRYAYCAF